MGKKNKVDFPRESGVVAPETRIDRWFCVRREGEGEGNHQLVLKKSTESEAIQVVEWLKKGRFMSLAGKVG